MPQFVESDDIIPLSQSRAGDVVLIVELNTISCIEELKNMGLLPGKEIRVISRTTTGSVIVILHNQRVGLGKDMAENIFVRKFSS